jgi:hypothetical protein
MRRACVRCNANIADVFPTTACTSTHAGAHVDTEFYFPSMIYFIATPLSRMYSTRLGSLSSRATLAREYSECGLHCPWSRMILMCVTMARAVGAIVEDMAVVS